MKKLTSTFSKYIEMGLEHEEMSQLLGICSALQLPFDLIKVFVIKNSAYSVDKLVEVHETLCKITEADVELFFNSFAEASRVETHAQFVDPEPEIGESGPHLIAVDVRLFDKGKDASGKRHPPLLLLCRRFLFRHNDRRLVACTEVSTRNLPVRKKDPARISA